MKNVTPKIVGTVVRVAEKQPEYEPVDVVIARHPDFYHSVGYNREGTKTPEAYNAVIMAFQLSDEERERIAKGEDVYVSFLTFGHAQQPMFISVGAAEMASHFDKKVIDG